MAGANDPSPNDGGGGGNEDYFNDLTQQPSNSASQGNSPAEAAGATATNNRVPKTKRIACVLCRRRKLKCDGSRPSCGTCRRLQHDCSYDEVRRKSGPKRGYVKALEARLAQVETLLSKDGEGDKAGMQGETGADENEGMDMGYDFGMGYGGDGFMAQSLERGGLNHNEGVNVPRDGMDYEGSGFMRQPGERGGLNANAPDVFATMRASNNASAVPAVPADEHFSWEMLGLGLDEPLPTQEVVDELNNIYFDKVHPALPMLHRPRYYAAMNLAPHMRPPIALRYGMWALAAGTSEKYEALHGHFYQRARKYLQQDEMKGHGESMISIAHCQTWVLVCTYEFKNMLFPRAWMSAGRACRMGLMMGLHRQDGMGLDVKQCLPPPKDWTEREERRRTFWMCFFVDRCASIGTGWPLIVEERDIRSHLPGDDESFETSRPSKSVSLEEALDPQGVSKLSPVGGSLLMACLFGRNLLHLHRPGSDDNDGDLNGGFWKRHRAMDNVVLNTALAMPDAMRLPMGLNNPNVVFLNMSIHTSSICLHQAAIFKADSNRMPPRIAAESKVRCITAAAETASIMRQICHLDMATMNPFIAFCLYVAARVFVQYLKSKPDDSQVKASLQFLLSAMNALKRYNPLTESFLVQLDVDLESAGLQNTQALRSHMPSKAATCGNPPAPGPYEDQRSSEASPPPLRNQMPTKVSTSQDPLPYACPYENQKSSDGRRHMSTYGDQGLGKYSNPNKTVPRAPERPQNDTAAERAELLFGPGSAAKSSSNNANTRASNIPRQFNASHFDLPHRSPAPSHQSPPKQASAFSTNNTQNLFYTEMDTSLDPAGSGSGSGNTPSSSSHHYSSASAQNSSHTSHTGFSPQQEGGNSGPPLPGGGAFMSDFMFTGDGFDSTADGFDMADLDVRGQPEPQQQGFVLPTDWANSAAAMGGMQGGQQTGMTPGAGGMGGALGGMNELVNLSEQEWNQVIEGMDLEGWEAGSGMGGSSPGPFDPSIRRGWQAREGQSLGTGEDRR